MIFGSPYSRIPIPEITFHDMILEEFGKLGPKEAYIDYISGRSVSYQQVKDLSYILGSALVRHGLKKGDIVLVYCSNCIEYPTLTLGTLQVGGIISTANPLYTSDELAHQLSDSRPKFLVCMPKNFSKAQEAVNKLGYAQKFIILGENQIEGCLMFENLIRDDGKSFPKDTTWNVKEDVAIIFYSSGTTGLPKGVMLTHHNLVSSLSGYRAIMPAFSNDGTLSYNLGIQPMFHLAGFLSYIALSPLTKKCCVLLPQFNFEHFLQAIEKFKPTSLTLPPALLVLLVKSPLVMKYDISSIQFILCGTAKATAELEELVKKKLNVLFVRQAFGMTETSAVGTFMPLTEDRPGSVGFPSPNTDLKIIDLSTGNSLGPDKLGEICLRGPHIMKGYLNNPKATAETIDEEGWLHTGDIGYVDNEGFVFIEDRLKELIKYKGYQVAPAELEGLLISHPDILDAAVIGMPDEDAGEVPKAYVVCTNAKLSEKDIVKFIADRVIPQKHLRGGVEFINEIPKTNTGKILRRSLKQLAMKSIKSKL